LAIRGSKNDFAIHDFAKKLNWRLVAKREGESLNTKILLDTMESSGATPAKSHLSPQIRSLNPQEVVFDACSPPQLQRGCHRFENRRSKHSNARVI
jgi:hypothetical protein